MPEGVNGSFYIFAVIIFLMILLLVWLISRMVRNNKKDNPLRDAQEQEARLFKLYQNLEDMMDSFESYVLEQQETIDEAVNRVMDVEKRLQSVYARLDKLGENESRAQEIQASGLAPLPHKSTANVQHVDIQTPDEDDMLSYINPSEPDDTLPEPEPGPDTPAARHQRVLDMYRAGKAPEDIARELGLTRGETSMIISMSKERYLW